MAAFETGSDLGAPALLLLLLPIESDLCASLGEVEGGVMSGSSDVSLLARLAGPEPALIERLLACSIACLNASDSSVVGGDKDKVAKRWEADNVGEVARFDAPNELERCLTGIGCALDSVILVDAQKGLFVSLVCCAVRGWRPAFQRRTKRE